MDEQFEEMEINIMESCLLQWCSTKLDDQQSLKKCHNYLEQFNYKSDINYSAMFPILIKIIEKFNDCYKEDLFRKIKSEESLSESDELLINIITFTISLVGKCGDFSEEESQNIVLTIISYLNELNEVSISNVSIRMQHLLLYSLSDIIKDLYFIDYKNIWRVLWKYFSRKDNNDNIKLSSGYSLLCLYKRRVCDCTEVIEAEDIKDFMQMKLKIYGNSEIYLGYLVMDLREVIERGDMRILVETLEGERGELYVRKVDKIGDVRKMIRKDKRMEEVFKYGGLSPYEIYIKFGGRILEDDETVGGFGFVEGSVVSAVRGEIRILVESLEGEIEELYVRKRDKIRDVMIMIRHVPRIKMFKYGCLSPYELYMKFRGRILKDDETVGGCRIVEGSVVSVVRNIIIKKGSKVGFEGSKSAEIIVKKRSFRRKSKNVQRPRLRNIITKGNKVCFEVSKTDEIIDKKMELLKKMEERPKKMSETMKGAEIQTQNPDVNVMSKKYL